MCINPIDVFVLIILTGRTGLRFAGHQIRRGGIRFAGGGARFPCSVVAQVFSLQVKVDSYKYYSFRSLIPSKFPSIFFYRVQFIDAKGQLYNPTCYLKTKQQKTHVKKQFSDTSCCYSETLSRTLSFFMSVFQVVFIIVIVDEYIRLQFLIRD